MVIYSLLLLMTLGEDGGGNIIILQFLEAVLCLSLAFGPGSM